MNVRNALNAVREVVIAAHDLLDDTETDAVSEDCLVPRQRFNRISDALDAVEALIPEDDQSDAEAGYVVTLIMNALQIKSIDFFDGEKIGKAHTDWRMATRLPVRYGLSLDTFTAGFLAGYDAAHLGSVEISRQRTTENDEVID